MKLQKVPGSVCAGCYAMKGRYRFRNVREALERRLDALQDPRWVTAMVTLITGEKYFRWHDSGDIQGPKHLENIFEVCKRTPETRHWMPTRESWVKAFLPECPDNLCIRFSVPMVDQKPIESWPNVSTVISSDKPWFGLSSKVCPAPTQNNECKDCRSCCT